MPKKIKFAVSLASLVTAVIFAYFQTVIGKSDVSWVAVGLGVFAVFAMWIFPEAEKKRK